MVWNYEPMSISIYTYYNYMQAQFNVYFNRPNDHSTKYVMKLIKIITHIISLPNCHQFKIIYEFYSDVSGDKIRLFTLVIIRYASLYKIKNQLRHPYNYNNCSLYLTLFFISLNSEMQILL